MQSRRLRSHPAQSDRRRKIVAARRCGPGTACRPIALLKAVGAFPMMGGTQMTEQLRHEDAASFVHVVLIRRGHEPSHIVRDELGAKFGPKLIDAELLQVFVEVAKCRQ